MKTEAETFTTTINSRATNTKLNEATKLLASAYRSLLTPGAGY